MLALQYISEDRTLPYKRQIYIVLLGDWPHRFAAEGQRYSDMRMKRIA
jgi:hypothetical protein